MLKVDRSHLQCSVNIREHKSLRIHSIIFLQDESYSGAAQSEDACIKHVERNTLIAPTNPSRSVLSLSRGALRVSAAQLGEEGCQSRTSPGCPMGSAQSISRHWSTFAQTLNHILLGPLWPHPDLDGSTWMLICWRTGKFSSNDNKMNNNGCQ